MAPIPLNIQNSQNVLGEIGNLSVGRDLIQNVFNIDNNTNLLWQRKYLNSAPYPKPKFFADSRKHELESLHSDLIGGEKIVVINGVSGIGKTSFASAFCADYGHEFDRIIWFHCEKRLRDTILKSNLFAELYPLGTFASGTPEDALFDMVITRLLSAPGIGLMVFDNADDGEDLQKNYYRLKRLVNWSILITSRSNNSGLPEHKIGALSLPNACSLFWEYYPFAREDKEITEKLLLSIGCHTLVTEVLARYLAVRYSKGKRSDLRSLYKELNPDHNLSLPYIDNVKTQWRDYPSAPPAKVLDALFDLSELDTAGQSIMQYLAMLPNEALSLVNIIYPFLGILDENDEATIDNHLNELALKGWLDIVPNEGYRMHPLVASFILKKMPPTYETCAEVIENLVYYLERQDVPQKEKLRLGNVVQSIAIRVSNDTTGRLSYLLRCWNKIEFESENYSELELREKDQLGAYESYDNNDSPPISFLQHGQYYLNIGNFKKALYFFEEETRLVEQKNKLPNQDEKLMYSLSMLYSRQGDLWQQHGDLRKAFEFFEKQSVIFEEMFVQNPSNDNLRNSLNASYLKLFELSREKGELKEAISFFDKRRKTIEKQFFPNAKNDAPKIILEILCELLGASWQQLGAVGQAIKYLNRQKRLLGELYSYNKKFEDKLVSLHGKIGDLLQMKGDLDLSIVYYKKQYRGLVDKSMISISQDREYKNELAILCNKLGKIYEQKNRFSNALNYFKKQVELEENLYSVDVNNEDLKNRLANSYFILGERYQKLSDFSLSLTFFYKSAGLLEETYLANLNNRDLATKLIHLYSEIGLVLQNQGLFGKAINYFEQKNQIEIDYLYSNYIVEDIRSGLVFLYEKSADSWQKNGEFDLALNFLERSNQLQIELLDSNPESKKFRFGILISYSRIGDLWQQRGNFERALEFFEKRYELSKELLASNPSNITLLDGLAVSYYKLGQLHAAQGRSALARPLLEKFREACTTLSQTTYPPKYKGWLQAAEQALAAL